MKSVGELEPMADELAREERQTEALKLAKDDALEEYNLSFQWIARTVESLCRLAGIDEVARRVRPSLRRPGVTARQAEVPRSKPRSWPDRSGRHRGLAPDGKQAQSADA